MVCVFGLALDDGVKTNENVMSSILRIWIILEIIADYVLVGWDDFGCRFYVITRNMMKRSLRSLLIMIQINTL